MSEVSKNKTFWFIEGSKEFFSTITSVSIIYFREKRKEFYNKKQLENIPLAAFKKSSYNFLAPLTFSFVRARAKTSLISFT